MLDGDNCVHKQIRAYAARILDLTEKEFVGLVEQQKVHGKALKRWRVFSRFFTYVNFGLLENVADIKLLGIVPEKIQMVQDWSTRMLEQLQQSAPVTPTKNKQVKTHIPLPVLTKKSIRPLPLRTGTNG
jgi:hypothetical protein